MNTILNNNLCSDFNSVHSITVIYIYKKQYVLRKGDLFYLSTEYITLHLYVNLLAYIFPTNMNKHPFYNILYNLF